MGRHNPAEYSLSCDCYNDQVFNSQKMWSKIEDVAGFLLDKCAKKSLLNKSHTPDTSSEKCLFSFGKQHTLSLLCFVSFWIEVSKS